MSIIEQPLVSLDINSTNAIRIPVGNDTLISNGGEKPEGVIGYIRYNNTNNEFEGFGGSNTLAECNWGSLGGVKNSAGTTKIVATKDNAGSNPDELQMTTNGLERLTIKKDGLININTTSALKIPVGNDTIVENKIYIVTVENEVMVINIL